MPCILRVHVPYPPPQPRAAAPRPMRVVSPRPKTPARPWTAPEIADLHKLCADGYSYVKIGALIGRSEGSVYRKAKDLGIPKTHAHCGPRRAE